MSKYSAKSSSNSGHPYMQLWQWTNGTLIYWRDSDLYSPETKEKLEQRLQEMADREKNLTNIEGKTYGRKNN
jgi:hypothetical protein